MSNGTFTFINYSGPNADKILTALVSDAEDAGGQHEVESVTQRIVGFMPAPKEEDEGEEEDDRV